MFEVGVCRGIVDTNIQSTMAALNVLKYGANVIHAANMAWERFSATAGGHNSICNYLAALNLAARDNHMGTLLSQKARNTLAYPATCPRD